MLRGSSIVAGSLWLIAMEFPVATTAKLESLMMVIVQFAKGRAFVVPAVTIE
jgi:hypothetical protein